MSLLAAPPFALEANHRSAPQPAKQSGKSALQEIVATASRRLYGDLRQKNALQNISCACGLDLWASFADDDLALGSRLETATAGYRF